MTPDIDDALLDELRALVAGDLPSERRAEIEAAIRDDPKLQEALAVIELERTAVEEWAKSTMPMRDFDTVYARVEPLLEMGESAAKQAPSRWQWLDWLAAPQWRPALAALLLLIVGQSAVIGWLAQNQPMQLGEELSRSARPGALGPNEFLAVTFKPDASEEQIRALLLEMEAQILAGPRSSGEYVVAAPRRTGVVLADLFRRQAIVLDARGLAAPPTSPIAR